MSASPGTLCIRADASSTMGMGHVMRCLALAQEWQNRGGSVCFISAIGIPSLHERLNKESMEVHALQAAQASEEDLLETLATARSHHSQWLVLDGYHFSPAFMLRIQEAGLHLLLLDDVADRDLSGVEAVLNQNAYATVAMHQHFAPCPALLLGASHTLLRREFLQYRGGHEVRQDASRVLVTLGGADPGNATQLVMQAMGQLAARRLEVRLILGAANKHLGSLQEELGVLREKHAAEILVNPPDMPGLMAWSDVTITAAGSSCWELCCLGVPQLMLVTADNQRMMPPYFIEHGLADVFGDMTEARVAELATRLDTLLGDFEKRGRLSHAARQVIDGNGAARVVEFMLKQQ